MKNSQNYNDVMDHRFEMHLQSRISGVRPQNTPHYNLLPSHWLIFYRDMQTQKTGVDFHFLLPGRRCAIYVSFMEGWMGGVVDLHV